MRELLGERLGHDRADAGPGGPGRAAAGGRAAAAHVLGDPSRPVRHLGPRGELDAATPGRPNLPGISSPALGAVSVAVAVALSVALSVVALEADGSWSLDSRRSGLELLQAGLNGRAVDFAKLGALYLHRGVWRGRQLVRRRWVADSARADTRTDPSPRL